MPATQPAPQRLLLSLVTTLLLAAGCATQGTDTGPASADRAERLQRRGDNAGAATMYEQLAQANPQPARNDFALAAARAWLAANRADDAQRVLDLATGTGSAAQQLEVGMLRAEVADTRGQYAAAWELVSRLPQPADPVSGARLLRLRQNAALRTDQPLEAVRAGIARDGIASNEEQRTAARRELLSGLRGAIENGLRVNPGTSNEPLVRGWLELAQLAVDAGRSPMTADAAVARWRSRFPAHPGSTIVDSEILRPGERPREGNLLAGATGPVALLLPLTGGLAAEAGLIRRGFEEALARQPEASRPALRIYDTGAEPVATALLNAQADGAGFIVGPLLKQDAQAAYEQRPRNVPLLLLNTLPVTGFIGSQIYQFALAPEDEARQIARQIIGNGQRNVLVFAPTGTSSTGDWGNRVAAAFSEELTRGGGMVIAQNRYDPQAADLATSLNTAVSAALGIDEAKARQGRVQQVIGATVQFDAHPRPDIDAIFVASYRPQDARRPDASRLINPLLRFFNADDLPTYVTQDGIGTENRENRDLEGMRVLSMPWDLDSTGPVATLRNATEPQWSSLAQIRRYFAFGYDAATLTLALRRGSTAWPVAGLTGRMQLTPEGRIERSMNWGVLKAGQVQPFDPVSN
jgi:outer membrane PBP1 activator LpoA protein